jgi:pimeloyl-ACP methyl ester carboxylesterase
VRRLALAITVVLLAVPAGAGAARFERLPGFKAPGTPAKYNKVGALQFGKKSAPNVLVLNPGTSASAAYFAPLARTIVSKAPSWQVWAVERRENLLEDHSVLDRVKAGKATGKELFDYYLNFTTDSSVSPHFEFIPTDKVTYARKWGMRVEVEDLRRVVQHARKSGARRIVVGGHSLGGSITSAYATWDFGGTAGAKGLAGLVFIDGGSGPVPSLTEEQAQDALADIDAGSPWLTFGGFPAPFAGLFNIVGAGLVEVEPNVLSRLSDWPGLPSFLKPPVPATSLGGYGFALDTETSAPALVAAQAHLGHLADSGDPRGWDQAGELTPIKRFADMFYGRGLKGFDGTAWYHPRRLTLDAGAVAAGNANPVQKVLGVRATHGRDLPRDLRLYAFGAALGGQRVLDATSALRKQSGIPKSRVTLVNRASTYAHNDPNSAAPKNDFVKYLLPFLRKAAGHK